MLAGVKLIAEPWDIGPGGYQLGALPAGLAWSGTTASATRARLSGWATSCTPGEFARRMTGSDDLFADAGRSALASINYVTCRTTASRCADLVSYDAAATTRPTARTTATATATTTAELRRRGADQRCRRAGPARARWQRALLATLLLAQGTPMLLAGDELGHSQQGNNNAYCQDNAIGWVDWAHADASMVALVAALTTLRRRYPAFRHPRWFRGHPFHEPGHLFAPGGDIAWLRPDGVAMWHEDWDDPWTAASPT